MEDDELRYKLLQTKIALLSSEVAGLKAVIEELTAPPAADLPALVLLGANTPAKVVLSAPSTDPGSPEALFKVSLIYHNLSASCLVCGLDVGTLVAFFDDLAHHHTGWEGWKTVSSAGGQFSIACEYQGWHYHPLVLTRARLAMDVPDQDPYWTVELDLHLVPDSLEELARQARGLLTPA